MNVGGRVGAVMLLGCFTGGCVVAPSPERTTEHGDLGSVAAPLIGLESGKVSAGARVRAAAADDAGGDGGHEEPDAELSWLDGADPEPDPWHDGEGGERSGSKDGASTEDGRGAPAPESSDGGADEPKAGVPGGDTLGPEDADELDGDATASEAGSPDESEAEAQVE